uniref:Carbonic anhydrase XIV n=1 Tax=Scleropages formosus TaxID=113540 RepID=A0A8C9VDM9_SCLFO
MLFCAILFLFTNIHTEIWICSTSQAQWPEVFPHCGGTEQSPINVETSQVQHDPSLTPVQPLGYNQPGNNPFTLTNNGHTVEMSLPVWMGVGGLPWHFTAAQLHLHWGSSEVNGVARTGGSEHTINGHCSAAELHIVHYNSDVYPNISTARTERNGLAVLGVLIETGDETNSAFANIFNYLGRIRYKGQRVSIPAFDVGSLLPNDLGRFFRYNGSLTTPPCYQSVLWTVFSEKVKVTWGGGCGGAVGWTGSCSPVGLGFESRLGCLTTDWCPILGVFPPPPALRPVLPGRLRFPTTPYGTSGSENVCVYLVHVFILFTFTHLPDTFLQSKNIITLCYLQLFTLCCSWLILLEQFRIRILCKAPIWRWTSNL